MKIGDITLKSNPKLATILAEYCEDMEVIPTQKCKDFFGEWDEKVPAKLVRQCIFAGIFWVKKHPEDIMITEGE